MLTNYATPWYVLDIRYRHFIYINFQTRLSSTFFAKFSKKIRLKTVLKCPLIVTFFNNYWTSTAYINVRRVTHLHIYLYINVTRISLKYMNYIRVSRLQNYRSIYVSLVSIQNSIWIIYPSLIYKIIDTYMLYASLFKTVYELYTRLSSTKL